MKRSTENWVTGVLTAAFLAYVALRAYLLPITHDEGATILNHVPRLVVDTLTFQKEANPNNHILNTLAIKILLGLFSGSQFLVRLPALIGCGLYIWAGVGLVRRLSEQVWVRLFGVIMLLSNPFLAEFFALARGYGLAAGLMMVALFQAIRFSENNQAKTLRAAFIFAGLAVYASFTLLLFFVPFGMLLLWAAWQQNPSWAAYRMVAKPAIYTFGVYLLLWITPLSRLSKDRELVNWGHLSSNFETIRLLIYSSVRGRSYLGHDTVLILAWASLAGMLISWAFVIGQWRKQNWRFLCPDPKVFLVLVFAGAVIVNLGQQYFLHVAQLNARLSLFYYPLFALSLSCVADWLWNRWQQRSWVYLAPLLLLVLLNNVRCLNLRDSFEWQLDSCTFEILGKIKSIQAAEGHPEPYTLDCDWIVLNSFIVHVNEFPQGYDRIVKHIDWHQRVPVVPGPEFLFVLYGEELNDLEDKYQIIDHPWFGVLLRKK